MSQEKHVEETVEKVIQEKVETSRDAFTKGVIYL